jgi:hypothetical protein
MYHPIFKITCPTFASVHAIKPEQTLATIHHKKLDDFLLAISNQHIVLVTAPTKFNTAHRYRIVMLLCCVLFLALAMAKTNMAMEPITFTKIRMFSINVKSLKKATILFCFLNITIII